MYLFEAVKERVSARQAADYYGIKQNRSGMACCPFHNDRNPSMKLDQRFHCFGCGADGDVIDFTARLFGLNQKDAAEKLAQDFGIVYDSHAPPRKAVRRKSDAQKYKEAEQHCLRVLTAYFHLLQKWKTEQAPASPEAVWTPQFVEALKRDADHAYLLDLFTDGSIEERAAWIAAHGKEVIKLEQRLSELTAGTEISSHGSGRFTPSQDCEGCQGQSGPDR